MSDVLAVATLGVILAKVAPILFAAIGGAFTQQANMLNIGLEGMMLIGAFAAISVGSAADSSTVGVVAAVLASLALALIFAGATIWLKADVIIVGIGVNLLAAGMSVFLLEVLYGSPGSTPADTTITLPKIPVGFMAEVPLLGPTIDDQTALVWLALLCVPTYWYLLYKTPFGVHLRAVGEDEEAAAAAGIRVDRTKLLSILASGALCGFAGAQLAMATVGSFTANMTAGRGFIALAALTFGLARPGRTLVACLLFGATEAIADRLGIAGLNSNLALMLPYVLTVLVLLASGLRAHAATARRRSDRSAPDSPTPAFGT